MTKAELRIELCNQGGEFPGIYKITHKNSNKVYIGQSICIVDRIFQHINHPDLSENGIDAAINKFGWEAFTYEVLEELPSATTELLWFRETKQIERHQSNINGYNKTRGNVKHCQKLWNSIQKYTKKHIVPKQVLQNIEVTTTPKLLIHNFDTEYLKRISYDNIPYTLVNKDFVKTELNGKLKEDETALGNYMIQEIEQMKLRQETNKVVEVISNPPYGPIGSTITLKVIDTFDFENYYNLEPGNDYFINGLYKYLDPNFRPIIYPKYSIPDAEQVIVLAKLQKNKNRLSELEARILLHLTTNNDEDLYNALREYILKVNMHKPLEFALNNITRRKTFVNYVDDLFMFNSGSYDIINGYYAVSNKAKTNYTDAIRYNVLKESITTASDIPSAYVKGCTQFKKIMFSSLGFSFMKLLFKSLPEGWGLKNLFINTDYSNFKTIVDVFNFIGLSNTSQNILLSRMSEIELTDKELEVVKLMEAF